MREQPIQLSTNSSSIRSSKNKDVFRETMDDLTYTYYPCKLILFFLSIILFILFEKLQFLMVVW